MSAQRSSVFAKKFLKRVILGNDGSKVRLGGSILKKEVRMSRNQKDLVYCSLMICYP